MPDELQQLGQAILADLWALRDDPALGPPLKALAGVFVLGLLMTILSARAVRGGLGRAGRPRNEDEIVKRPTNTHVLRRLWWKMRPPRDLMRVDGLVIDRTRKPHAGWFGPTGAGKSASVATVRVNGERATLCAMPDLSDPLRAAAARLNGFIWTACESRRRVNFLLGEPTEVAERLTEVFRSGGTGAWKRAARRITAQVIRDMDAAGVPRNLMEIGQRLQQAVQHDRNLALVCAGWVDRFLDMADQFGESIGSDGVDLAELLNRGETVVLDVDAFDHPSLGGDVVALGLAEAKRCASLVPGGFRLIFEEAGQLGERIDLAEPFHRAGRRRRIAVDDLTQAESDLNEGISANIATRVYFGQELKSLQKVAADRLGLDYRELDPAKMADFTAWIAHGRIRRLVKFPKPKQGKTPVNRISEPGVKNGPGGVTGKGAVDPGRAAGSVWEIVSEDEGWKVERRPLGLEGAVVGSSDVLVLGSGKKQVPTCVLVPGSDGKLRRFAIWERLRGTWSEEGCHLWPEDAGRNKAYGKTSYLNRSGWETHFLFWAWRVIEDYELGRRGSLEKFYDRYPEVPRFLWPERGTELIVLDALKEWMREPFGQDPKSFRREDSRCGVRLSLDHACPGFPNTLCGNYRHLQLITSGDNSRLRHTRRTGAGRLAAEEAHADR
jgi:hypothetical protein